MAIHKAYAPDTEGDGLMLETVSIAGAPEYDETHRVYNTTNLAQIHELGTRANEHFQGSDSPAFVRMFMRREAPYVATA